MSSSTFALGASYHRMRIAAAQQNYILGDVVGNSQRILSAYYSAMQQGADLVVFSELAVTGYPPEDLVFVQDFQEQVAQAVQHLAQATVGKPTAMLVGAIAAEAGRLTNSAYLLEDGRILHRFDKCELAMGGVFDEKRTFHAAEQPSVYPWRGMHLACLICQDIWNPALARKVAQLGADVILSPNASPFDIPKEAERQQVLQAAVTASGLPILYVNQMAGMDEIMFDGGSRAVDAEGVVRAQAKHWQEALLLTEWCRSGAVGGGIGNDVEGDGGDWQPQSQVLPPLLAAEEHLYSAAVLGLRDYLHKHGWQKVLLGLSGGVDSALVAAMAVDALGAENVRAVMLPSRYTSQDSLDDAADCARRLGMALQQVDIEPVVHGARHSLLTVEPELNDLTRQNLQSRARGMLLMGLSNHTGALLLSTGNKSENAVGYCTLYGDMCGAYNPIKDLYKMQVYALCRWRNAHVLEWGYGPVGEVIPLNILVKAPSAELKPNQRDEDNLPPYPLLDWMLQQLVEGQLSVRQILAHPDKPAAVDAEMVEKTAKMLYAAEYKRRQAAPGPKLTRIAFARDRRYPLTNGYISGAAAK